MRHCDEMCYIGHKLGLNATLTATENLRYLSGYSASPIALEKALKQFHLNRFADQLVLNLSAGQKKRVALSHLVSNPSRLWLLDEPFASLDADSAQRFNELLLHRTQHSEGATVLVSHERQALPFSSTIEMDDS